MSAQDAGGVVGPEVIAACGLSAVPGIGASSLERIAAAFGGSLLKALEQGAGALLRANEKLKLKQEARDYLARDPDLNELGEWAVSAAKAAGARVVLIGDDWYPARLREIAHPPQLLYVRGSLVAEGRRVAVVGSRNSDDAGLEIARTLGDSFARGGVAVVSGGARGIDTAAHEGALWGSGATIAVLGCGIDVAYPPENSELFDRIARGAGAVISEFPPGTEPLPNNFPRRNRTIAGLSDAVIVVRAALQSGALITANHAAQNERRIFAVPGDPSNPMAKGPNELLRAHAARAVTSAADVMEKMSWPIPDAMIEAPPDDARRQVDPGFPSSPAAEPEKPDTGEQVVDEESLRLWRLLDERTPAHVDDLAQRAQMNVGEALRKLAELELKGMCLQRPGKYFLRR